jgi:hypothetical protein
VTISVDVFFSSLLRTSFESVCIPVARHRLLTDVLGRERVPSWKHHSCTGAYLLLPQHHCKCFVLTLHVLFDVRAPFAS